MQPDKRIKLSQDMVRAIAAFAGITLTDDRVAKLVPRLERYLQAVNTLDEVNISEVEPDVTFLIEKEPEREH